MGKLIREYLVDFGSGRRWFLSDHLTPTLSDKTVKFFRSEVVRRWPVQSFRVDSLTGNREELVAFLQEEFKPWKGELLRRAGVRCSGRHSLIASVGSSEKYVTVQKEVLDVLGQHGNPSCPDRHK